MVVCTGKVEVETPETPPLITPATPPVNPGNKGDPDLPDPPATVTMVLDPGTVEVVVGMDKILVTSASAALFSA